MSRPLVGLMTAAGLIAASFASGPCLAAPSGRPAAGVALIVLDGLRYDRFGASETPALERFARGCAVFSSARSPSPWSPPAAVSLLTGMQPSRHGVATDDSRLQRTAVEARTLAEALRDAGWKTAAFAGGRGLAQSSGLSAGFDVYEDSPALSGLDRTVGLALSWLDGLAAGERFLLVVHGCDLGCGGASPLSAAGYDARVRELDRRLQPLLERLAQPRHAGVLVAVLSDHGRELGERGALAERESLFDESLRVPLLLRVPGSPARRIDAPVRLVDVLPTVLDYAGVTPDPSLAAQLDGVSLRPLLEGRPLGLDAFAETRTPSGRQSRAIVTRDGWKAIGAVGEPASLYRLDADPGERHDLAALEPARALSLRRRLEGAWKAEGLDLPAARSGVWKALRQGTQVRLYDLSADPYLLDDRAAREPAVTSALRAELDRKAAASAGPSEALRRKLREAGYW